MTNKKRLVFTCLVLFFFLPYSQALYREGELNIESDGLSIDTLFVDLENSNVNHFVHDFDYVDDYQFSYVSDYLDTLYRPDWPAPVIIEHENKKESIKLIISQDDTLLNCISASIINNPESDNILIYNLTPGVIYYYSIVDSISSDIIRSGAIKTLGQVRMINAGKVANVRDIGGWKSSLGGRLKYGRLFRGGTLEKANEEELFTLQKVGVTSELDLRKEPQTSFNEEVNYHHYALGNFFDIENVKSNADAIRILINELVKGENVYVHCVGGADRTGVLCMLIEGACGVSESDMAKDYELTSFCNIIRKRTSGGFPEAINYIKSLPGASLQIQFISYLQKGGLSEEETNNLIEQLVDIDDKCTNIKPVNTVYKRKCSSNDCYKLDGSRGYAKTSKNCIYIINGKKILFKGKYE